MKNQFELSYKDLKSTCNPNIFKFETTESLEPIASGIGQDRGIKALEFCNFLISLEIRFNVIYMCIYSKKCNI